MQASVLSLGALEMLAPPGNVMELMSTPVGRVRAYTSATYVTHVAAAMDSHACIREGMLNRCAAAPARVRNRAIVGPPIAIYYTRHRRPGIRIRILA